MHGRTWKLKSSLLCTNRSNFLSYSPPIVQLSFHFPNFPLVFRVLHSIYEIDVEMERKEFHFSPFGSSLGRKRRWGRNWAARKKEQTFQILPSQRRHFFASSSLACMRCFWLNGILQSGSLSLCHNSSFLATRGAKIGSSFLFIIVSLLSGLSTVGNEKNSGRIAWRRPQFRMNPAVCKTIFCSLQHRHVRGARSGEKTFLLRFDSRLKPPSTTFLGIKFFLARKFRFWQLIRIDIGRGGWREEKNFPSNNDPVFVWHNGPLIS